MISPVHWYEMKAGAAVPAWKFCVFRQKEGGAAAVSLGTSPANYKSQLRLQALFADGRP
jgi:hypothetical protein